MIVGVYEYPNGRRVVFDRSLNGWYSVILRDARGDVLDKVRCDDYRTACEYRRAFRAIARNGA